METPDAFCGPVNLGNPVEFTMRDLAERVIRLTRSRSAIVNEPLPINDPLRRRPDITLVRDAGLGADMHLEDGLRRTVAYFSQASLLAG